MSERRTLGEAIFVDIESNAYLNELHEKYCITMRLDYFS